MDERITKVAEMLEADAARLGTLPWDVLLRVCDKNRLSAEEIAQVRRRLLEREVPLEVPEGQAPAEEDGPPPQDPPGIEPREPSTRDHDAFAVYLHEAAQFDVLDAQEERELMRRIRAGEAAAERLAAEADDPEGTLAVLAADGQAARDTFITANLRLVVYLARRVHRPPGVELHDLIQDGNLGLLRAVAKFEHDRGYRFSTYAVNWIRSFMSRAIADRGRLVRLPVYVEERLRKVRSAQRTLARELGGREPSTREISSHLGWEPELVQFVLDVAASTPVSIDRVIDEQGSTLGDFIGADPAGIPELQFGEMEEAQQTNEAVARLPERLRRIIEQRFGLGGSDERTLKEIGEDYALSRERIRQLETIALDALRKMFGAIVPRRSKAAKAGDEEE